MGRWGSRVGGQDMNEEEADFLDGLYGGEGAGEEGEACGKVDVVTEEADILDRLFDYGKDQRLQQGGVGGTLRGPDKGQAGVEGEGGLGSAQAVRGVGLVVPQRAPLP